MSLPDFMRADGVDLKNTGQDQYKCRCPFHEEKTPSCHVRLVEKWIYHCFGCGSHGDTADYLQQARGMSVKESLRMADDGYDSRVRASDHIQKPRASRKKEERIINKLPPCDVQYLYPDKHSELKFIVQRYYFEGEKRFAQFTPRGDKWKVGLDMDKDRPLYNLKRLLEADPDKFVLVVEGEKCVELLREHFPNAVVVCWPCGANSVSKTDWSPLFGRNLMLCADANPPGYLCMYEVAQILDEHCDDIKLVLPKFTPKGEKAIDVGDIVLSDPESVPDWLKENLELWNDALRERMEKLKITLQDNIKKATKKRKAVYTLKKNPYFKVLGIDGNCIVIEQNTRNLKYTLEQLSASGNAILLNLCTDQDWWANNFEAVSSLKIIRELIALAEQIGKPRD